MKVKQYLINIFSPNAALSWMFIFVLANAFHFFTVLQFRGLDLNKIYQLGGDASQYIESVERIFDGESYSFFKTNKQIFKTNLADEVQYDKGIYFAFRTPGFAFFYYPVRLIFSKHVACSFIIIFQVIFNAIAKYFFCLLALMLFKRKTVFYVLALILLFSGYSSFWNNMLMTESLAVSSLIFALYFFVKGYNGNARTLFISGMFFMLAIFLRPFLVVFLLPFSLLLLSKFGFNEGIKYALWYTIPFIVVDSLWIIRNHEKTKEFIPLSKTIAWKKHANLAFKAQLEICEATGVTYEWWVKKSPMYWLTNREYNMSVLNAYPESFFSNPSDTQIAISAKEMYLISEDSLISKDHRAENELIASTKLSLLLEKYKSNNPLYWLDGRVKCLENQINQPLLKPFISIRYPLNVLTVVIESLVNRFVFLFGGIATLIALFRFRKSFLVLSIAAIPIFIVGLFVLIFSVAENREMFIPYYFFAFFGVELLADLIHTRKTIQLTLVSLAMSFIVYYDVVKNIKF